MIAHVPCECDCCTARREREADEWVGNLRDWIEEERRREFAKGLAVGMVIGDDEPDEPWRRRQQRQLRKWGFAP